MTLTIPGRVVVFDYGEVISVTPTDADRAALLHLAGVSGAADTERFWTAYWRHREPLDEGTLSITVYWATIAAEIGTEWSRAQLHELWLCDYKGWLSVNPGTIEVLHDLLDGGTRLAILSNAGRDFGSYMREGSFGALFERVFVSGELGLVKPGSEIYHHVMSELGVSAAETVFIDNRADNVEAAEALGITGHVFTSPAALRGFLGELAEAAEAAA